MIASMVAMAKAITAALQPIESTKSYTGTQSVFPDVASLSTENVPVFAGEPIVPTDCPVRAHDPSFRAHNPRVRERRKAISA